MAPPCSSVADLEFHWRQVVQSCEKQKREEKLVVIEETHGPKHMKKLLKVCSAHAFEIHMNLDTEYHVTNLMLFSSFIYFFVDSHNIEQLAKK